MTDIVLYDRNGQPVTYTGVETLTTDTPEEERKAKFTHGELLENLEIPLNFSNGENQSISAPDGYLVRDATILKPEALKPENIKKDEVVAGVKGTLIGNMEETTVDLDMTDGDQEIVPSTEDFLISKVTIKKPETLQSKNIVKDVVIGGVKGTYEGIRLDNLEVVFPINEVTVPDNADGMVPIMSPLGLKSGQIYLIMWNNTGYVCTAQTTKPNGITMVALGNSVAWGGDDTGEPFAVCEVPEKLAEQAGGIYGGIIPLDGSTTFTAGGYFIGSDGYILEGLSVDLDFSNGDQTLTAPDGYLVKSAVIEKPATLIPENIAKGETVAGVVGTNKGPRLKPIRFYDPYGNVLESYTRAEIQKMTELPPGPPLGDLTFSKWTHTLAELKAVPYFADVGPCYQQNGSDVVVLIVDVYYASRINHGSQTLYLNISDTHPVTVSWGDGSSTKQSSSNAMNHEYTNPGRYIVTIKPTYASAKYVQLGTYTSPNYYYQFASNNYQQSVYNGNINNPGNLPLFSILSGLSIPLHLYGCTSNTQLKMFSSFSDVTVNAYGLMNNPALDVVCAKSISFSGSVGGARNLSLKRYPNITNIAYDRVISECRDLEEVIFENTPDKLTDMNNRWAMLMTQTTPPTLTADTVRTWGTKPIYVPDSAVEAYKTANVWSTVADYIIPASQYPD